MPDCFEFKEDDISLTLVWATLPSLPLECWHPNALGKIGSRIGTPIAMDSLTMNMERVSYARILVESDRKKCNERELLKLAILEDQSAQITMSGYDIISFLPLDRISWNTIMKLKVPEIPRGIPSENFLDRLGRSRKTAVAAATGAEYATAIQAGGLRIHRPSFVQLATDLGICSRLAKAYRPLPPQPSPPAATPVAAPVKPAEAAKSKPGDWMVVNRRNKGKATATTAKPAVETQRPTSPPAGKVEQGRLNMKAPQPVLLKDKQVPSSANSDSSSQ
ncbi:UNVERIFIED_CONTAM: hypothetical protein Sindi_3098500 [Sesamum indicum]